MSDYRDPRCHLLLDVLRIIQAAEGYEFCDRCREALVDEALRCDHCCGEFGTPPTEQIEKWIQEHPGYFERFGPQEDDYADECDHESAER